MGWLKLTEAEKRIILQTAERAKNERFSSFECQFRNAFLDGASFRVSLDKEQLKKELQNQGTGA